MGEEKRDIPWAEIEGEYVNSKISQKALAEKYNITLSALQKQSAKGKWSEKRKKFAAKKAKRVSEKLHDKDVNKTVKDIERVCAAAGRLIEKANKAINQLDKQTYISLDEQDITASEENIEGKSHVHQVKKRKMRTARLDALIDTKRMSEIAKSLKDIKEILTGEDGKVEETSGGVIEIGAQNMIDSREESNENDMESAAAAGGNDVKS